jgi:broad specificity phosphatase PhoE
MPDDTRPPRRRPAAPQPTVICLVRHGTTPTTGQVLPGQASGLHLSERGLAEASATAERLSGLGAVAAVYCSQLERARETAQEIASRTGHDIVVDPLLADVDTGEWTGSKLVEVRKQKAWGSLERARSTFRFPGGESFAELVARVALVVERICAGHPGQVVVAVSHADPIKAAVATALGTPLDLFDRIGIAPASVTAIAYGPAGPSVLTVGSTSSLSDIALLRPVKAARR